MYIPTFEEFMKWRFPVRNWQVRYGTALEAAQAELRRLRGYYAALFKRHEAERIAWVAELPYNQQKVEEIAEKFFPLQTRRNLTLYPLTEWESGQVAHNVWERSQAVKAIEAAFLAHRVRGVTPWSLATVNAPDFGMVQPCRNCGELRTVCVCGDIG